MKQFRLYLLLEGKRIFKKLPGILLGSTLLLFFLAGVVVFCQTASENHPQKQKLVAAIAAEPDEPFVDFMLSTLKEMKNTKDIIEFVRMTRKEAVRAFNQGKVSVIFFVPNDYIKSIIYGENKHIRIRYTRGQKTIVSFLMRQLCTAASSYILDTEAGIYALQDYYKDHNLPDGSSAELELNLQYIRAIASLHKALKFQTIEVKDSYPTATGYFISGIVLFLLLWGITFGTFLTAENDTFLRQLSLAGITLPQQFIARCLVFLGLNLLLYVGFFGILSLAVTNTFVGQILPFDTLPELWLFALRFLPILFFSCSLIQCIYAFVKDALSGSIFLFGLTLLLGMISGCFYPFSYLPETIQTIAGKLPLYHGIQYGLGMTEGKFPTESFIILMGYSLCFYGLIYFSEHITIGTD